MVLQAQFVGVTSSIASSSRQGWKVLSRHNLFSNPTFQFSVLPPAISLNFLLLSPRFPNLRTVHGLANSDSYSEPQPSPGGDPNFLVILDDHSRSPALDTVAPNIGSQGVTVAASNDRGEDEVVDHQGRGGLTQEIVDIAKSLPQHALMEDILLSFHGKISTTDANQVLKSLADERLGQQLSSVFQWMRLAEPCLLDARSFCIALTYLGKLGFVDEALALHRNMPEDGKFHCLQVYNSLLGAAARCDRREEIAPILDKMGDRNIERDSVTDSILIAVAKGGESTSLDDIWNIVDDMLLTGGLRLSVTVYGSLVKAFCDGGHLDEALLISVSMEKWGIFPDLMIYNILIDAHSKALKFEEAEGILVEMKEKGLRPTESTYNALIYGYARNGQSKVAEELVLEMQKEGLIPDVFTYATLITAYGKQKMTEKAVNVFLRMKKAGLTPTSHTYTTLINAYTEGGWHEKAQRAFDNMTREGLQPTADTYTALLAGYARSGDLEMVKYVWNIIKGNGCDVTKMMYRTLMDAFAKYGFYTDARDVMEVFQKRGLEPDTAIYNKLLNAYARGGICTKLPTVLREMQDVGCEPDSSTYCVLIYACVWLRNFTKAFDYDKEMDERGLLPDPKIYMKLRNILDAKYANTLGNARQASRELENDPTFDAERKRRIKRYLKQRPSRGTERAIAFRKDKKQLTSRMKRR